MVNPMLKRKAPTGAHVHVLIARTAQDMCFQAFSDLMHDNVLFSIVKSKFPEHTPVAKMERAFVQANWGQMIPAARATLAGLLTQPINEALKDEIAEALILDKTLMKGRAQPTQILGALK